jgi:hypothetical protein
VTLCGGEKRCFEKIYGTASSEGERERERKREKEKASDMQSTFLMVQMGLS